MKKTSLIALAYLLLSFLLRFTSFSYSVIDHDESTYLIISRALLAGKQLYVDVFDTKPAGIFLIFAAWQAVFGYSIAAIRCLAALTVAATGLLLCLAKQQQNPATAPSYLPIAAGGAYVLSASVYGMGLAANTELFFNFFTAAALLAYTQLWQHPRTQQLTWAVLAGLLLGIGFIIKYFVLLDALALAFIWVVGSALSGERRGSLLRAGAVAMLMLVAMAVPFGLLHIWCYVQGNFAAFYDLTYQLTRRYSNPVDLSKAAVFVYKFHVNYCFLVFPFYYLTYLYAKKQLHHHLTIPFGRINIAAAWCWYAAVWVAVLLTGKYFSHYSLQLLLPLCWVCPDLCYHHATTGYIGRHLQKVRLLCGLIIGAIVASHTYYYTMQPDLPRQISRYLSESLRPNETIFTGNYRHIIYYLLDQLPPTKYIHPSLLYDPQHQKALQIDGTKIIQHIIDEQQARFVIIEKTYPNAWLQQNLPLHYRIVWQTPTNDVKIYERVQ